MILWHLSLYILLLYVLFFFVVHMRHTRLYPLIRVWQWWEQWRRRPYGKNHIGTQPIWQSKCPSSKQKHATRSWELGETIGKVLTGCRVVKESGHATMRFVGQLQVRRAIHAIPWFHPPIWGLQHHLHGHAKLQAPSLVFERPHRMIPPTTLAHLSRSPTACHESPRWHDVRGLDIASMERWGKEGDHHLYTPSWLGSTASEIPMNLLWAP
jgi:hypothetical protein